MSTKQLCSRSKRLNKNRLKQLGIESGKDHNDIRTNAIYKTLDLTDSLLKLFFIAVQSSPQWMFESIDTELANSYTQRYNIYKRFTGPLIGLTQTIQSGRNPPGSP